MSSVERDGFTAAFSGGDGLLFACFATMQE